MKQRWINLPIPVYGRVFSSASSPPDSSFFWGVAFEGSDIIFQEHGLMERNQNKTTRFKPEEGSYIIGEFVENKLTLRTDPFGNCKLYLYRRDGDWAISDSYYNLLSFAKEQNFPLTPNIGHIEAQRIGGMMGDQFISFTTAFEEVRLLPQWQSVEISSENQVQFHTIALYKGSGEYMQSLVDFLNKARSRMKTWIEHPRFTVSSDITGGIDSRIPLAMIASLGLEASVSVLSKPGDSEQITLDREISTEMVDLVGFRHLHAFPSFSQTLTFETWRERCLGLYPIFFVRSDYPFSQQRLTGKAGELYRNQYRKFWKDTALGTIDSFRTKFHTEAGFSKAKRDFLASCEELQTGYFAGVGIANAHYRSFRNRFHFAQDMSLEFYSSREFQHAFDKICPIKNEDFFSVYHDMIRLLYPQFLEVRFDSEEKDFSQHWSHLTSHPALDEPVVGQVFAGNHPEFLFENPVEKKGRTRAVALCADIMEIIIEARENRRIVDMLLAHGVEDTWSNIHRPEDLFSLGRKFKPIDLLLVYHEFFSSVEQD